MDLTGKVEKVSLSGLPDMVNGRCNVYFTCRIRTELKFQFQQPTSNPNSKISQVLGTWEDTILDFHSPITSASMPPNGRANFWLSKEGKRATEEGKSGQISKGK